MLASLEADRARVAELQARILHLERSLSELRIEQSRAQERIDSYRYPVLTLPTEIISEIFIRSLPSAPDFPVLFGGSSPALLIWICRRWREIALDIPQLWRVISWDDTVFVDDDEDELKLEARTLSLWLERSRDCPLYLRLVYKTSGANRLLDAVAPHRTRWQHLELRMHLETVYRILSYPSYPLLRHLEVTLEDRADGNVFLRDVPLLRTVVFNDTAALRVTLPWGQLTSLTLFTVFPSECVPILIQAQNLIHCELDVFFDEFNTERRDIVLLYLESLVLTDGADHSVTDFLPTFTIPALRTLTIPEGFLTPNPIDSLAALISTSGCRLEELHLTGERLLPKESYRKAFPFLRKLLFDRKMADDREDSSLVESISLSGS
ncbi:hypothetical protein C8R47DRAFT_804275 [Mycena vitilis]|nr:hypothetical protein C8R47DRAFT_804275 [Mycena vitilis]